jgi:hypothetical protein
MKWILESSKSKLTCVDLFPWEQEQADSSQVDADANNLLWNLNSCSIIA